MKRAVAAVLVVFALAVSGASAKDGARATLTSALPLDVAGGSVRIEWRVHVPDGHGGRQPFGASRMFVRLLGRAGGRTTAFDDSGPDGRLSAEARVPNGGIGGIRVGLRGTTDILFPLENDPFTTRRGIRCDVAAVRATFLSFVRAYNRGDLRRLDTLFSRARFEWYSSVQPGPRVRAAATHRDTLRTYFRARYRRGDRLAVEKFRLSAYEPMRELGHFVFEVRRRADDFRDGKWFNLIGKGSADCARRPITLAVVSFGDPE
jgi:hypothetical protein